MCDRLAPKSRMKKPQINSNPQDASDGGLLIDDDSRQSKLKNGKSPARCFGQDLMRGEHTVGETASLKGGLTHGTTIHPYDGSSSDGTQSGTSIFDPVLCELVYRWFCPEAGTILDPFAGGSVRGIVAARLGRQYVGLDLRQEQIEANRAQGDRLCSEDSYAPVWHCGDSRNIAEIAKGVEADLVFSCPPYADLEVYSDDPQDLSTLSYESFIEAYRLIIERSLRLLKPDRFACFVVGDLRDKKGFYRNFPGDTINAFESCGAILYNECILVTVAGSLPIRVRGQFCGSRKLGKTHQNVLVFFKGNPKNIRDALGEVVVNDECFAGVQTDEDPASLFGEVL